jgi:hypothetical protein
MRSEDSDHYINPRSPFKRPYRVNFKNHEVIEKLYNKNVGSKTKIMDGMQQQPDWKPDGKRLFIDRTNQSHTENMYPILAQEKGGNEFFHRRHISDYPEKSLENYQDPPIVK